MSVLLLAGTTEGRHIAAAMAKEGIAGHASIAGVTEDPAPLALPTRIGGFGGAEGFETFLHNQGIRAVVDATHPYAARITGRTAKLCAARGMPYLHVLRHPWAEEDGDEWTHVGSIDEAVAAACRDGGTENVIVFDRTPGAFRVSRKLGEHLMARAPAVREKVENVFLPKWLRQRGLAL